MDEYSGIANPEQSDLRRIHPQEVLPSPFGSDINIPATQEEDEALEKSIAESGIQNPIICKTTGDGKLQCLAGTRRLRAALKTGLTEVPVLVAHFKSEEEERQFAIRDNIERRQLSTVGKAKLALLLWRSFKKSSSEKGKAGDRSAREKAATAASISAGTLFNYVFVLTNGNQETIDAMESESITVGAAYSKTKALIDGATKETAVMRSVNAGKTIDRLKGTTKTLETLPKLSGQIANLTKFAVRCKAADKERLRKRLSASREVLTKLKTEGSLDGLLDVIIDVETLLA